MSLWTASASAEGPSPPPLSPTGTAAAARVAVPTSLERVGTTAILSALYVRQLLVARCTIRSELIYSKIRTGSRSKQ
jgi:hypothetical protein